MSETQTMKSPNTGPGSQDIDIQGLLLMVWRRKWLVIAMVIAGLCLAYFALTMVSPRYTAKSLILVKSQLKELTPQELSLNKNSALFDVGFILTELEVLKSRNLAARVIKRLDLVGKPEFSIETSEGQAQSSGFRKLSVDGTQLQTLPPEAIDKNVADAVSIFLDKLNVTSIPGSLAVQITFTSKNPYRAAEIANTLVDEYVALKLTQKQAAQQKLTEWLDSRLQTLSDYVVQAETEIEQYKNENNLTSGKRDLLSAEQLSVQSDELINAQSRLADAKAQYNQINSLDSANALAGASSRALDTKVIRDLQGRILERENQLTELSNRYGPKHPEMIKRRAELDDLQRSIDQEFEQAKEILRGEMRAAQAKINELRVNLSQTQEQQTENSTAMIGLRELEREADSSRLVLKTFLETYKRTLGRDALQDAEVDIISYASVPYEASYPNVMLILSLGAFISLFMGLALAILIEKLDNAFRSAEQLENVFGLPCYTILPKIRRIKKEKLGSHVITNPASISAEEVRNLLIALGKNKDEGQAKTVAITSSISGEGSSTLSLWLARIAAKAGQRTMLIDGNLRSPEIQSLMGVSKVHTLLDFLTAQNKLEDIVQKDEGTNLHLIYGSAVPNSAFDLISSERMNTLIKGLKEQYDLIVIDTPPSLELPDAKVLAKNADDVVYVVSCDKTPRDLVVGGIKYYQDTGYKDIGFVLSNVKVGRGA